MGYGNLFHTDVTMSHEVKRNLFNGWVSVYGSLFRELCIGCWITWTADGSKEWTWAVLMKQRCGLNSIFHGRLLDEHFILSKGIFWLKQELKQLFLNPAMVYGDLSKGYQAIKMPQISLS